VCQSRLASLCVLCVAFVSFVVKVFSFHPRGHKGYTKTHKENLKQTSKLKNFNLQTVVKSKLPVAWDRQFTIASWGPRGCGMCDAQMRTIKLTQL
jgi:hypothetical protein